jgi:glyoxylase-like metal-dependent hydrolase (beta-lactamase superfamily II)
MRSAMLPMLSLGVALLAAISCVQAATLQAAASALDAPVIKSIEYSGTGRWFQFGQAPGPDLPWPAFVVSSYTAGINYDTSSARVQITRSQVVEAGRLRPAPEEQRVDQYLAGASAWNRSATGNAGPPATAQPASVEERTAEIWASPQGFLKAALANQASSRPVGDGVEVSFTLGGKHRYVGTINAFNQVTRVQTWIDSPVLGDTLADTKYSAYKDFGGVTFPGHIVRSLGGHPVLDLRVSAVKVNAVPDIPIPKEVASAKAPAITVDVSKLADGVYYLTGGTHHSVAIEQRDHIVVVEAPLSEARSLALIAKIKETIPGKPIKYLVNTHAHFDHAGGLRTFVAQGATIVTQQPNQPYYQTAWAAPRTLNPDWLARSHQGAHFETFTAKHTLSDGARAIEIYPITGNGHNDAFALVYLPAERILIEADAYTPAPVKVGAPAPPNPYIVNLYQTIRKLKLDVAQIAALHGPGVATLADLRAVIGPRGAAK